VSTINGAETGIGEGGVNACEVEYDKAAQTVVCSGVAACATVAVYNLGGVSVGKAVANGNEAVISLAGQPQGAYILVIKDGNDIRTHRFVKW
jgi:hypothetical protein